ncbi:MAG TPA: hypothetical protein VMM18_12910 [Gemmatimonadaceae bacterium]|nr:hypothetical protein [Gemmatimonadaceae bacterium]
MIAALAEDGLEPRLRADVLPHVAGCASCRSAVASVARALESPSITRELAAVRRVPRRGLLTYAVPIAAAAVLLLLAIPHRVDDPLPPHRAAPITASPAPTAVWPVGVVSGAPSLRWTAVSGADRYRVTLFDAEGTVLHETELDGTITQLPASVVLDSGRPYWWRVEARTGFDRWTASDLIEFAIAEGARR